MKKCWLTHKWRKVDDTGANLYYICDKCGDRKVTCSPYVYQPIKAGWKACWRE